MPNDINDMNFKQLRNEVQLLRDELAIMQRKYEDILYNLDDDNFSSRLVKEKGDMKTAIEVTAEGIKTKVSKEELEKYSTIEQTAESIQSVVSKGAELDKAEEIESLEKLNATGDKEKIYVIPEKDDSGNLLSETYYYFNDITKQWEVLSGDSIYTVFEQTPEGFALKGNVLIDGDAVVTKNLTLSGVVTWDMTNSPVKTQYSVDGSSGWHDTYTTGDIYMRMSFDGGKTWNAPTKVVGTDGKNGTNGSNANVTFNAVNSALCNVFKKYTSGTPTTISDYYLWSPEIQAGKFYGCLFYAGNGQGYSEMYDNGFSVYDYNGSRKVKVGYVVDDENSVTDWTYPYILLGEGVEENPISDSYNIGVGCVYKIGSGLWIGDSCVTKYGSYYPGNHHAPYDINMSDPEIAKYATGLFIDLETHKIFKYIKGVPTEL